LREQKASLHGRFDIYRDAIAFEHLAGRADYLMLRTLGSPCQDDTGAAPVLAGLGRT
jgi:hypothetical protein